MALANVSGTMPRPERAHAANSPAIPIARAQRVRGRTGADQRTVRARLKLTEASLERLLALTGSYNDFVLSAADGSATVRVGVEVSSVPGAAVPLGSGVVLDWATMTIARGS